MRRVSYDMRFYLCIFVLLSTLFCSVSTYADVVKPALVEITAKHGGEVSIEIRTSIEALLTGINAQYKNTQDAPQAEAYDALRVLQADELAAKFEPFKPRLLQQIRLQADEQPVVLQITAVDIPEPGYTRVPRPSLIMLSGQVDRGAGQLRWYYPAAFGDNAVRVRQVDEVREKWHWSDWQWLRKDEPSLPFSLTEVFRQQSVWAVVKSYVVIGFTHILPKGLDHILFILGIFLFSTRLKPLFWQVTMFTIAHTITLGLSMNGVLSLPAHIVEPLIALSIAYVGVENIVSRQRLHNSRLLLVFAFGLLHGMGFAGVLAEFGMPDGAFAVALIAFNVGVELGQLAIILLAYVLVVWWFGKQEENTLTPTPLPRTFLEKRCFQKERGFRKQEPVAPPRPVRERGLGGEGLVRSWFSQQTTYQKVVVIPGSLLITIIGLYWTIERLEWL